MNEKNAETARKLVDKWRRDIGQVVKYERMEDDIARALSSRDTEIREVLEGLRGKKCWCEDFYGHSRACLAARRLWERVEEESDVTE